MAACGTSSGTSGGTSGIAPIVHTAGGKPFLVVCSARSATTASVSTAATGWRLLRWRRLIWPCARWARCPCPPKPLPESVLRTAPRARRATGRHSRAVVIVSTVLLVATGPLARQRAGLDVVAGIAAAVVEKRIPAIRGVGPAHGRRSSTTLTQRRRILRLLLVAVPQTAQAAAVRVVASACRGPEAAVPAADLRLLCEHGLHRRRGLRVGGQPCWE